jgi:CRP/FNR family transcriptional regulator
MDFVPGLPSAEAEELAEVSEVRRYSDGAPVFIQGEGMPGMFLVIQGALKVFRTDGRRVQVLDLLQAGACVGGVEAFDGGLAASGAEAMGETVCWLVPATPLRLLAGRSSTVALWLLQHLAGKVRHLVSLVETLSLRSVPERVAHLILEYQGQNPGKALVEFIEKQEDAAQRIGTSREAFSRALRLLADLGMIKNSFPVVRILDLQKLRRYAGGWGHGRKSAGSQAAFPPAPALAAGPALKPFMPAAAVRRTSQFQYL